MQIHLIGSNGYIGKKLLSYLNTSKKIHTYSPCPISGENFLELTKPDSFDFNVIQPGDYVIFLAAISSPDICEKEFEYAYSINVTGTREYIKRFIERKANVLFFSSDVVIGGTTGYAYDENGLCRPFGNYGRMKKEVEDAFKASPYFKVFRLSYVFSREDKFTRYLYQCNSEGQVAEVFDALKRNVIYLYDILEAVQKLADRFTEFDNTVFHLSGPDLLSRKDLADIYRKVISSSFTYSVVNPPGDFFKARPNIIETKSLYLSDLLGRSATPISTAFMLEYNSNMPGVAQ